MEKHIYKILAGTLLAFTVIIIIGYGNDDAAIIASGRKTIMHFPKTEIDLGILKQGVPAKAAFFFTNHGEAPLVIYNVETSCGCTGAEWPKQPVKAGEKGEIKVIYDAREPGMFIKTITVYANLENGSKVLKIKGSVDSFD